jgi:hypothetical protein
MAQDEMICSGTSVQEDPYDYVRRKSAEITYTIRPGIGEGSYAVTSIISQLCVIHGMYTQATPMLIFYLPLLKSHTLNLLLHIQITPKRITSLRCKNTPIRSTGTKCFKTPLDTILPFGMHYFTRRMIIWPSRPIWAYETTVTVFSCLFCLLTFCMCRGNVR